MSGTETTVDEFKSGGQILWRKVGRRFLTSYWLAIGSLTAGTVELVFGLLSSAYETVYSGYAMLLGLPFRGWEELLEAAWLAAARSISGSFGPVAWIVAVLVIVVFFLLVQRALRTVAKGVTP